MTKETEAKIRSHRIAIARLLKTEQRREPAQDIIRICCEILGVGVNILKGRSHAGELPDYRKIVAIQLRDAGYTLKEIGKLLGGRSHCTVVAYQKTYRDLHETCSVFRVKADACRAACEVIFSPEDIEI